VIQGRRCDGPRGYRHNVSLAPPLREVLAVDEGFIVASLPIAGAEWLAVGRRGVGLELLDSRRLHRARVVRRFCAAALEGGTVIGWSEGKPKDSVVTGVRVFEGRPAAATIAAGGFVIGSDVVEVRAWNTDNGKQAWEWIPEPRQTESGSGNSIRTDLCSDGELVYFGLRDGTIRALSVDDGKEVWRTVLVRNPDPVAGEDRAFQLWAAEPTGSGSVRDGVVYFHASDRAVALEATSGRHIWEAKAYCTDAQLHLDSYHCLGVGGEYEILDARTGRRQFKKDLKSVTPAGFHNGGMPTYRPMVVSDTHLFCGYGIGYLLAFERTTGRLVWHTRAKPPLSFHQENYFQIVNGRLYTGDYGTMRIYEEVNPTDPVLIRQRAEVEVVARQRNTRLPVKVAAKEEPKDAAKKSTPTRRAKKGPAGRGRKG